MAAMSTIRHSRPCKNSSRPQEIVEITYTVGSYYANGLLTKALRIEVETDGRETVAGKC